MLGREKKEDEIDYLTGIILNKKIGDKVESGETLAWIHAKNKELIEKAKEKLKMAYKISDEKPENYKHILEII